MVGWIFFDWTPTGVSTRYFGWKYGTSPGWGIKKSFWLESMKVRRSGERVEMWSGGPKEDVTRSNGQIWAWGMYGLGAGWVQWTTNYSEVPEPRLFDHMHRDACT